MQFKIALNGEIFKVSAQPDSFQALRGLVEARYGKKLPESWHMEYKDADDDWVRVCNDEDFQIWKEDFEETKGMKLIVQADLKATNKTDDGSEDSCTDSIIDLGEEQVEEGSDTPQVYNPEPVGKGIQEAEVKQHSPRRRHGKPGRDCNTVESFQEFREGWVKRFEKLLAREDVFSVMLQAKKRCKNLMNRCPRGKGNRQQLKGTFKWSKKYIKDIVKSDETLKELRKMAKKGETKALQARLTELQAQNSEVAAKMAQIREIFNGELAKITAFRPRRVHGKHGHYGGRHRGGRGRDFVGRFFDSSESSGQTSENTSSDDDSKASGQPFKVFLAGWLTRFENLLKNQNPFVVIRQARFRAKNLVRRIPRGHGNIRRAIHILREGKWAVKGFLHEHKGIANMVKSRKMGRETLTTRWVQISAKNPKIVKELDEVMAVFKTIHERLSQCEFVLDSENTSSESSDHKGHGRWKKHWKGGRHGRKAWKCHWKSQKHALKEMKHGMSKEEWKERKAEWKARKQDWKANNKGRWAKKNHWFKNKIESKVQEQIDRTIAQAVPQIALQVAQILNANQAHIPNDLPKMERIQKAKESNLPIHKGFVCDGCGVGPIIGDCYKCSVCQDFDFCQQCEATVPHPHPFLKIRNPEQRPNAIFTVVADDKDKPHPKLVKRMKDQMKKCKAQFKACLGSMKQEMKKAKQAQKKVKDGIKKQAKVIEEKAKAFVNNFPGFPGNAETPSGPAKGPELKHEDQALKHEDDQAKPKVAKLMEFFQLKEEHRDKVTAFVMSQKASAEIPELTNLFIDQVLPGLSMN